MRGLLRLAIWGTAASAAVLAVVVTAGSSEGQHRLAVAWSEMTGTRTAEQTQAEAAQAAQLARLAATENETRRLTEIVRSLTGDRERLVARVAVLERNLDDVTGSLQKQAAATPPPVAQPQMAPPPAAVPESVPSKSETAVPAAPASAPAPATSPAPPPSAPPHRVANLPPPSDNLPELEAIEARPVAGIDLGSAPNFDGLRTLWSTLKSSYPSLLEGLDPLVIVRENSKSRAADLRLVAGPVANVETANRICSALAVAKRPCRMVAFEGQPLALNVPRRPAATAPKQQHSAQQPPPRTTP